MRLLLLRHAKSDWSQAGLGDEDRPLAPRGIAAAEIIAAHMHRKGYVPRFVLCSTARRTRETLERLLSALDSRPPVEHDRRLYLGEWRALLDRIRRAPAVSPLLLVGHNPGVEELALKLVQNQMVEEEQSLRDRIADKFPTAAFAVLDFALPSWRQAAPGMARLTDFVRPKDLTRGGRDG